MSQAFEQMDVLIISTISPRKIEPHKRAEEHLAALRLKITDESEKLRAYIISTASKGGSPDDFGLFIHNSQATITDFLDHVYEYRVAATEPALVSLYNNAEAALEDIYYLLKDRYADFFNPDGRVPLKFQQEDKLFLQNSLPYLRAQVKKKLRVAALLPIALEPIECFLGNIERGVLTYRFMWYVKKLCRELEQWAGSPIKPEDPEWDFIALLIKMNVNSDAFCTFWCAYLAARMEQAGALQDKMNILDEYNRRLWYVRPDSTIALHAGLMPLKDYVQEVVSAELAIVERDWLHTRPQPEAQVPPEPKKKIKSALSVALEGVWIRAGMYAGRWLKTDFKEVMGTWTEFVESKEQRNISRASMLNKSRPNAGIEPWEKQLLKDILYGMLRYVNSL